MSGIKLQGPKDAKTGFRWIMYIVGGVLALIVVSTFVNAPKTQTSPTAERFFSGFDGSHKGLEEKIKSVMNDPDSYEHVETRYRDQGSTLHITTKFRGKNGFGGTVTRSAKATISSYDGQIIDWEMLD